MCWKIVGRRVDLSVGANDRSVRQELQVGERGVDEQVVVGRQLQASCHDRASSVLNGNCQACLGFCVAVLLIFAVFPVAAGLVGVRVSHHAEAGRSDGVRVARIAEGILSRRVVVVIIVLGIGPSYKFRPCFSSADVLILKVVDGQELVVDVAVVVDARLRWSRIYDAVGLLADVGVVSRRRRRLQLVVIAPVFPVLPVLLMLLLLLGELWF